MIYYMNRALAVAYLVGWLLYTTSLIGVESPSKPLSWFGAWAFVWVLAVGMWLGWQARKEREPMQ